MRTILDAVSQMASQSVGKAVSSRQAVQTPSRRVVDRKETPVAATIPFGERLLRIMKADGSSGAGSQAISASSRDTLTGTESHTTGKSSDRKGEAKSDKGQWIVTPFGVFDPNGENPSSVRQVEADSEWKGYFMTHAPGEWMYEGAARDKFAEIYGSKALVTLDWDGTVPENVDTAWITKRKVDADGRPIADKDLKGVS